MPATQLRQNELKEAKRLVVKVGSALVTKRTDAGPGVDVPAINRLMGQVVALIEGGREVVLVCSGAVAAGCAELGLRRRPTDLAELQAVAAIGQRKLMALLHSAAKRKGHSAGQMLLTRGDFDDRVRFLNIRNCAAKLHELGAVPVLNENDTVAVEELRFGDNDLLAAMMTNAIRADALILLTSVDGLLDENDEVIDRVDSVLDAQRHAKTDRKTSWGSGGMKTKLDAARLVTEAGELAVIAPGKRKDVLLKLVNGEKIGTVFAPAARKLDSRQRWIGLTARPAGTVSVDDGATRAMRDRGKSLLASGITEVTGRFMRGDVLLVRDARGKELARGLTNYSADELALIQGKRSDQFEKLLGRAGYAAVIHRDNLVLLGAKA
ncbi:MAG: glutamate 5-kinase [Phycisphaeraceae bacterium]